MSLDDDSSEDEVASSTTNVMLGYASPEPTGDEISYLGGKPTWLSNIRPSYGLVRCKVCRDPLSQLLQLNGELPDHFPTHERRLHILACRRRACSRKAGSIRALRASRHYAAPETQQPSSKPKKANFNIGNDIFGGKPAQAPATAVNPFAKSSASPFTPTIAAPVKPENPLSFATIAKPESVAPSLPVSEPWPTEDIDTNDFPKLYLDAAYEELEEPDKADQSVKIQTSTLEDDSTTPSGSSSNTKEDTDVYESDLNKVFQRFADRLAQNPEQVLRYEYQGNPLLYAASDDIGKIFHHADQSKTPSVRRGIPGCSNCGKARTFEFQLVPHAILELEAEDMSIDGMEWGTILVYVCQADCQAAGVDVDAVGYHEEWVGVQWEELKK